MPFSVLTINGDSYNPTQAGDAGIFVGRLTYRWDEPDDLTFLIYGCNPTCPYSPGVEVTLSYDSVIVFRGDFQLLGRNPGEYGWIYSCRANGLMARSDWVCITGQDATGVASYNRSPTDSSYVQSDAGLTIGEIFRRLLCIPDNANKLAAVGIGNYVSLSPPTLPTATLLDLALMDVVPPKPVLFSGNGILNHMQQEAVMWCPRIGMRILPDGTIRFQDLFALTAYDMVNPTDFAAGDPITTVLSDSTDGCYTAFKYIGVNVQPFMFSVVEGTMAPMWTTTQQYAWKYTDHTSPNDRAIEGSVVSLTSTSATVDPSSSTAAFASNSLSGVQAQIYLVNPAGVGINIQEFRIITTNTALTAGGTFTVGWDASMPLDATGYTKFYIQAKAGGANDIWRAYQARESSGLLGLATFVGSRLMPRFPRPISFANLGTVSTTTTPMGFVLWSSGGTEPWNMLPLACEIDRSIGGVRFTEPVVKATVTAGLSYLKTTGTPSGFAFADGKPYDVRVVVPYNRGGMEARVPTTGYRGTAYTSAGITRIMEVHVDDWQWIGDRPDILKLADEHLKTMQDIIYTGSISHIGLPTAFSPWGLGMAINAVYPGPSSTEFRRVNNLPVRQIEISWDHPGTDFQVDFQVSNFKRPFQGDSLWLHPSFGGASAIEMGGGGFDAWNELVGSKMSAGPMVPERSSMGVAMEAMQSIQNSAMLPDPTEGLPSGPPSRGGIGNAGKARPDDFGSATGVHAFAKAPNVKGSGAVDTLTPTFERMAAKDAMAPKPQASGVGDHPMQFNPASTTSPSEARQMPNLTQSMADVAKENREGVRNSRMTAPTKPGDVIKGDTLDLTPDREED